MSNQEEFKVEELLPLYVFGELDDAEHAFVEQALMSDQALREELDRCREDMGNMLAEYYQPMDVEPADLDRLQRDLLAKVSELPSAAQAARARETRVESQRADGSASQPATAESSARQTSPSHFPSGSAVSRSVSSESRSQGSWMVPLALAASVLSLAVAFWALGGRGDDSEIEQLRGENLALAQELDALRAALNRTTEEVARVSTSLQTFGYPRSSPIVLAGLQPAPDATGAAFYRPSSREALFFAFGLPDIDPSSVYQLWYITEDGPVSAGTFEIDAAGEARVLVANVPDESAIATWAVTREPAGGSPQPTGPMLIKS